MLLKSFTENISIVATKLSWSCLNVPKIWLGRRWFAWIPLLPNQIHKNSRKNWEIIYTWRTYTNNTNKPEMKRHKLTTLLLHDTQFNCNKFLWGSPTTSHPFHWIVQFMLDNVYSAWLTALRSLSWQLYFKFKIIFIFHEPYSVRQGRVIVIVIKCNSMLVTL